MSDQDKQTHPKPPKDPPKPPPTDWYQVNEQDQSGKPRAGKDD